MDPANALGQFDRRVPSGSAGHGSVAHCRRAIAEGRIGNRGFAGQSIEPRATGLRTFEMVSECYAAKSSRSPASDRSK